jgi:hypothetical protein
MKFASIVFATLVPLAAQEIKLPPSLDRLADKAVDVVDVSMDASLLQLAARFLSDKDPDEARVKKLVSGLKGIYVKSFEFENRGEYQESDVEPLRAMLRAPGWSRMVGVRSKRSGDNAEVFLKMDGDHVTGLVVIIADPKELTIVNIVGAINPEEIRDLGGHFGIPRLDLRKGSAGKEN